MPRGRPRIEIDINEVERLASQGLTQEQIADCLGIHKDTFFSRKREFSEFADAIKRGQAKGIEQVTNALFEQAMAGNTVAAIFFLKNRAGWKDAKQIDGNLAVTNKPDDVSATEQWLAGITKGREETKGKIPRTH